MPSKSSHGNKPVITPLATDGIDLLQLHVANSSRYPYLLQSVAQPDSQACFDILFACPQQMLMLTAEEKLELIEGSSITALGKENENGGEFLDAFEHLWKQENVSWEGDCKLPFSGGWFLFLGYELARQIEPRLKINNRKTNSFPVSVATRIPAAIIYSHSEDQYFMAVEEKYENLSEQINQDIQSQTNQDIDFDADIIEKIDEDAPKSYLENVERIKSYIREGDVFQVNLSRQWQAQLRDDVTSAQLYQRLKKTNPAPFFALANYGQDAIISSSPERLVKVQGKNIDTRPIAGTRPRGTTSASDQANLEELIKHPKERAEHIMLIDLERNDLGRVCEPGSVVVNELMVLETYSHVHHIVSNVQGRLRDNASPSDVIKAVFPGGTITGCPKVRCMEIIAELEQTERGPYTGSLGYVSHSGDMDLNILIRTLVKQKNKLTFRAGAGIVADSVPENELEETRTKAKGLLLAL